MVGCVLAIAAVSGGLILVGRGTHGGTVTTPNGAPISITPPRLAKLGGVFVNEVRTSLLIGSPTVTLARLPGSGRYRITVTNISGIGFLNGFDWYAPTGMEIVKVIRSSSGHCAPSGTYGIGGNQFATAVLDPGISCDNLDLNPPTCTCTYNGGSVDISIIATITSPNLEGTGAARATSMSPVFKIIPSQLGATRVLRPAALTAVGGE